MALFRGLSAFPMTPADDRGRVDTDALAALLARLVEANVDSIGLLGSTGIYPYLHLAERLRAVEAAVRTVNGRVPVMVGIGALRTDHAIALGRDARNAGADAVLLAPISYISLTDDEVFEHFSTVAEAVGLPLCIYNNPTFTHFSFSPGLTARLSRVPLIEAVKNPVPKPEDVRPAHQALEAAVKPGFSIGYSGDWRAAEALQAGGVAWYSVLGGLFPNACLPIVEAAAKGDAAAVEAANARLQPLWDLFIQFGSLRVVYTAMSHLGLSQAQPPRPILPLADEPRRRVIAVMQALDLS